MLEQEIKDLYDANPNLTLVELANITGRTVGELKQNECVDEESRRF